MTCDAICPVCRTVTVQEASIGTAWRPITRAFPCISVDLGDPVDVDWDIDHDAEHLYRCSGCGWKGNALTVVDRPPSGAA